MKSAITRHPGSLAATAVFGVWLAFAQSPLPAVHEGFVDVPGAKVFYRDYGGGGVPIVFLHAYTGTADAWEYQIPAFTGAGYRFVAYDRRGFGRTAGDANGPASTSPDDLLKLV